jgi:RNA polymerase sigma-70 factor (ECF subfamily)
VTADISPSDAVLAVAARNGDAQAFAALMCRHKSWLYRFIRNYAGDREEAHDLLQESFVSAWRALSRFDAERPFTVWLRRIALNKCRDNARRGAVRRAALTLFSFAVEQSVAPPGADDTRSDDDLQRLESAIANLPRALKEPMILTALEGLSHKEAAELLGITAKAVEVRVYRAKRRLSELLNPGTVDGSDEAFAIKTPPRLVPAE